MPKDPPRSAFLWDRLRVLAEGKLTPRLTHPDLLPRRRQHAAALRGRLLRLLRIRLQRLRLQLLPVLVLQQQ